MANSHSIEAAVQLLEEKAWGVGGDKRPLAHQRAVSAPGAWTWEDGATRGAIPAAVGHGVRTGRSSQPRPAPVLAVGVNAPVTRLPAVQQACVAGRRPLALADQCTHNDGADVSSRRGRGCH